MPPSPVTLYGLSYSAYTRIARLALEEKAVPYQLEEVEIFGAGGVPAAHAKRHPFGKIPVLTPCAVQLVNQRPGLGEGQGGSI